MKHSIKLACVMLILFPMVKVASAQSNPNVIFIFIDDMGYYDLSSYGATEVKTTQTDKLAEQGIRFTDFYAAAPICSPSRAGLLTGCYPRRVNKHVWVHRPDSETGLNPESPNIAKLFQQNGYKTACIGKWHLGFKEPFLPQKQGFDHYFGILHNLDEYETIHFEDVGGIPVLRNGEVVDRPADPEKMTRWFTEEAIRWIGSIVDEDRSRKQPFFLYLPHTMLHVPLGVSPRFVGTSDWGEYGDAIMELDYYTGLLMDKLNEFGIADNTIVVYMSDNGRGPGRNPDQPIRGSKLTTWEGGIRVPCIIWGPGVGIQQGVTSEIPAHAMDWFPTLASLAGIKIPEGMILDGRDLSGLLQGKTDSISFSPQAHSLNATIPLRRYWNPGREWRERFDREEYLNAFFYHGTSGELAAVRSGKWKLHLNPDPTLYNLETDPGERNPINDQELNWKLRGMSVTFQEEMQLFDRP